MGIFAVTPEWVGTFETAQHALIQDSWDRVLKNLIFDKFVEVRPSTTLRELYFWLIETAQIHDEEGAQKVFDSVAATYQEIVNKDSGSGLQLSRNEIEDNVMAGSGMGGMPAMDYAANWARQIGGASAYWPQQKMFELILSGEGTTISTAYDGLPFFHAAHPVNPLDAAAGTYSNILTGAGYGIDTVSAPTLAEAMDNFDAVCAAVRGFTSPNGKPRMLRPKYLLAGPKLDKRSGEVLDTKFYGQDGSTENVISRRKIEPVIADELTHAKNYYVVCELITSEGGPLIFQDRMPYVMSTYTPDTQAVLQMRKKFLWSFDGRNVMAFGQPYTMVLVKP